MRSETLMRDQRAWRQNYRQAKLSYFFVTDELRELSRLLRGRCPDELREAINKLQEARRAGTNAQISAISVAIRTAQSARLLLNSEDESTAARMIVTNIAYAAGDVLTQIAALRSEAEVLIAAGIATQDQSELPLEFILNGLQWPQQDAA